MTTREADEKTIVGDPKFVASLATSLEETPFELSDEASETSWCGIYEFELVLNVTLGDCSKENEY